MSVPMRNFVLAIVLVLAFAQVSAQPDQAETLLEQGLAQYDGKSVPQNKAEGFRKLKAAADLGHARAQLVVGVIQTFYEGAERNPAEGVRYLQAGAERNQPDALYYLALAHDRGTGVARDPGEAVRLYTRAATLGQLDAQTNLGLALMAGEGVPADPARGALWLRRAADAGNAVAQQNIGLLFSQGRGVSKDDLESYKYLKLSAASGRDNAAQLLAELRGYLNPEQMAEGERRAAAFKPAAPWRGRERTSASVSAPTTPPAAGGPPARVEAAAPAGAESRSAAPREFQPEPGDEAKAINRQPPMSRAEVEAEIARLSIQPRRKAAGRK